MQAISYTRTTNGIRITATPTYLEKESFPEQKKYVWSYAVIIENTNDYDVQLLSRRWFIADEMGRTERIEGDGVVGERPVIASGEGYRYQSGAPLSSPSGMMMGIYTLVDDKGHIFDAEIPAISLDSPLATRLIN